MRMTQKRDEHGWIDAGVSLPMMVVCQPMVAGGDDGSILQYNLFADEFDKVTSSDT